MMGFFFFFQAEDGIRDLTVTGVQTCALPISDEILLSSNERFCDGENRALKVKPAQLGDSYQIDLSTRVANSTRLSPPVLPMMIESLFELVFTVPAVAVMSIWVSSW